MMDAEDLAFEERPNTFSRIGVNKAADAFAPFCTQSLPCAAILDITLLSCGERQAVNGWPSHGCPGHRWHMTWSIHLMQWE
jgi:hypothetical protein